jgi:hypothetical protein
MGVEVINGSFTVNQKDPFTHLGIDGAPL